MKKISITLPEEILADLSMIANAMGISRSAFIAELLSEPIGEMMAVARAIPQNPTKTDLLRFRGESEAMIKGKMRELDRMVKELYSEQN